MGSFLDLESFLSFFNSNFLEVFMTQNQISNKVIDLFIQENLTYDEADKIIDDVKTKIDREYFPLMEVLKEQNNEMLTIKSLLKR